MQEQSNMGGTPHGVISVFGSSAPKPGSPAYEQAREMGRLLARAGYTVATGGYSGTMEATSRGAAEAGGHVIGVTCEQIENFRPLPANQWVLEVVPYPTLRERLVHLVMQNDGMVVLPGGIGTISEMALAWSLLQVEELTPRPLVLLGELWRNTMQAFIHSDYVQERHARLLQFADTPEEAVATIATYHQK